MSKPEVNQFEIDIDASGEIIEVSEEFCNFQARMVGANNSEPDAEEIIPFHFSEVSAFLHHRIKEGNGIRWIHGYYHDAGLSAIDLDPLPSEVPDVTPVEPRLADLAKTSEVIKPDISGLSSELRQEYSRLRGIERAATRLFIECWMATQREILPERGPIPDATLALRDALNPRWPNDSDWLPEPLASERAAGYPNLLLLLATSLQAQT